ncbi:helix-hairpin-helix domain-containing protein, partial [bacterium]|nr:helix-hairpin-helix domain-containing protein [bacterium]
DEGGHFLTNMLGLTKQEQGIALFLIFALTVGAVFELYHRYASHAKMREVNTQFVEEFQRRAAEIDEQNFGEEQASATLGHVVPSARTKRIKSGVESIDPAMSESLEKFLININTAGQRELQRIPRVGPVTAQKIIDLRLAKGGFTSIEQLVEVRGIGKATLEKIKPYITIN